MKKRLFTIFLTLVNLLFVASVAVANNGDKIVGPGCWAFGYEPELPERLK
jgi:cyclic lactone autoinducer peptide